MKELSVEEKAKLYDEAKLRMSAAYNSNRCSIDFMNEIFPELKESEDERIRKELLEHCKNQAKPYIQTGNNCPQIQSWIAWLEKLGEPTDINPSEFDLCLNKLLKQFETLPKEELASSLSFYLNVVQNDGTYREEKQGEQKPTAWSEEDEKIKESIITGLEMLKDGVSDKSLITLYNKRIDWLKSLKERVQPKQEWSEEDKSMMESILSKLHLDENVNSNEYYKYHHWLKSLKDRVQPQSKQQWSEEDENAIQVLKNIVKHSNEIDENIYTMSLKEKLYDWLKSLRPQSHWKPSEEQITWLYRAADNASKDSRMKQILNELLSNLKKLREE